MNETIEPYVKKLLDGGMKTAEDVAKFIETQTPELGKELIMWGSVSELVAPLTGVAILIASIWLHLKYRKDEDYNNGNHRNPPAFPFVVASGLIGLFMFMFEFMDVLYPIVAPRLYILEKISSFVK